MFNNDGRITQLKRLERKASKNLREIDSFITDNFSNLPKMMKTQLKEKYISFFTWLVESYRKEIDLLSN
jgi:hypothetical protein